MNEHEASQQRLIAGSTCGGLRSLAHRRGRVELTELCEDDGALGLGVAPRATLCRHQLDGTFVERACGHVIASIPGALCAPKHPIDRPGRQATRAVVERSELDAVAVRLL
jgi:hypothetical protein